MNRIHLNYNHPSVSDNLINKSIYEILSENVLLSMASIKDKKESWINTAYFAYNHKLTFYFLTPPTTQHGKNIEENHSVASSIFDSHQNPDDKKRGLQIIGICRRAKDQELAEAIRLYGVQFPPFAKRIKTPKDFANAYMESRFYIIQSHMIKIFDEVVFGEEKWVIVNIPR